MGNAEGCQFNGNSVAISKNHWHCPQGCARDTVTEDCLPLRFQSRASGDTPTQLEGQEFAEKLSKGHLTCSCYYF